MKWIRLVLMLAVGLIAILLRNPGRMERSKTESVDEFKKVPGDVRFTLEGGEEMHARFPATFEMPDLAERQNLKAGDLVKLMFNITNGTDSLTERMWVLVESKTDTGYTGKLDNDPYCTDRIKAGLIVTFEPRHVISIWEEDPKVDSNLSQESK